ncbi:hypothetical protein [Microseira sp. BLCC-F43]|jgi:hypothetical protein|uniref:hypothetical protein n=1 Tax=Microseira sp. BLCC-F43 TaxID=3153602 RepID=UPI0035BB58F1
MNMRSQTQTKTTPKPSFTPVKTGILQRKCACGNSAGLTGKCTECQNKQLTLQRRSNNQAEPDEVPPIVHEADTVAGMLQRQGSSQDGGGTPSACVVSEEIPTNRSGLINRGGTVGERFQMNIDWRDSGSLARRSPTSYCDCSCGEYRQYIKGHVIINGRRETIHLWGGAVLEENVYHEDGLERNPRGRYGHRNETQTTDEDFLPDRATGCSYRGRDFPRIMIGSEVDMLYQFKGQTYDSCNQTFGSIHEWEVRYVGPIIR